MLAERHKGCAVIFEDPPCPSRISTPNGDVCPSGGGTGDRLPGPRHGSVQSRGAGERRPPRVPRSVPRVHAPWFKDKQHDLKPVARLGDTWLIAFWDLLIRSPRKNQASPLSSTICQRRQEITKKKTPPLLKKKKRSRKLGMHGLRKKPESLLAQPQKEKTHQVGK